MWKSVSSAARRIRVFVGGIVVVAAGLMAGHASAAIVKSDFQTLNDGLLLTDTDTGLTWLSPFATRNTAFSSVLTNFVDTGSFRVGLRDEVFDLLSNEYGITSIVQSAAQLPGVQDFFGDFGINASITCSGSPCPRTQGWTFRDSAESHISQVGAIILSGEGGLIASKTQTLDVGDSFVDLQMGTWLVQVPEVSQVPVPAALPLLATALGVFGLLSWRRRRRATA